jgi:hypothetical protein
MKLLDIPMCAAKGRLLPPLKHNHSDLRESVLEIELGVRAEFHVITENNISTGPAIHNRCRVDYSPVTDKMFRASGYDGWLS